ncbi:MAG: PspA/IM30 family protein [Phormidium sp. GEM2.Bin31]|nr:MAG: PspA/IM30 family protein [Phormidium sp. GEM2.Bin31]
MKKAVYWLMGDWAGRITINTWNWLWGKPPEAPPDSEADVITTAELSLKTMQQSVQDLEQTVRAQRSAYRQAELKYKAKLRQVESYEKQAAIAQQQGDKAGARLAMTQAIRLEKLLPQIGDRLHHAQAFLQSSEERLQRETIQLEAYRLDVEHLKDMAELGDVLDPMSQMSRQQDLESARSHLDDARSRLELQRLEEQALTELSQTQPGDMEADSEHYHLNEEVERRLQQFDQSP